MKKIFTLISLMILTIGLNAQIFQQTINIDASAMTADTTAFYSNLAQGYPLSITVTARNVVGTGGTLKIINTPNDTLTTIYAPDGIMTINSDTNHIFLSSAAKSRKYGIYFAKGSITAGDFVIIIQQLSQ